MVDRAVRVDWVLLAAGGMAAGPDAESSGACYGDGTALPADYFPILSLVVLSRLACVYWRASRLLSDGGETSDMIDANRSPSIAIDRHLPPAIRERSIAMVGHRSKNPRYS
jgi:hypothetical protein